jgi:hypothetical protein
VIFAATLVFGLILIFSEAPAGFAIFMFFMLALLFGI